MNVTITYLSPIEVRFPIIPSYVCTNLTPVHQPSDWVLQSFPFSYVYIDTTSLDGRAHQVQVYSELTGGMLPFVNHLTTWQLTFCIEWLSDDWYGSAIRWNQYSTKSAVAHIQLENPQKYAEYNLQARDGEAYFAMASVSLAVAFDAYYISH